MTSQLTLRPKGHETYDVLVDGVLVGSVWAYRYGWAAFDSRLRMVSGLFDSPEDAAEVLT